MNYVTKIKIWLLYYGIAILVFMMIFFLGLSWRVAHDVDHRLREILEEQQYVSKYRDWHDYGRMLRDQLREGPGEQGAPFPHRKTLTPAEQHLVRTHGFNALISNHISLNRSVPDIRHPDCRKKRYLAKLPTASIIMIFYNEHMSVLLRSLHSIINQSPRELLKEIILVDDCSTFKKLKKPLERYIREHLPKELFKPIIRLPKREGLIRARLAGMRHATGDVIIVLDSHIECNYNWLPPLLEPIAENPHTVVLPLVDVIDHSDFSYDIQDDGARGVFDWKMDYKRLPLWPEHKRNPTKPYPVPIMAGGLLAIQRDFFWHLGGYDAGLEIWGGEQYELSFKIWMCGGNMVEAPCSRVAHIYRSEALYSRRKPQSKDYIRHNLKRVAEIWMDEYKKYVYHWAPEEFKSVDAGDISDQVKLRKRLKCKSFNWFMTKVAPDILVNYPVVWPTPFAHGSIRSAVHYSYCIDGGRGSNEDTASLALCDKGARAQNWELSGLNDLRVFHTQWCLEPEEENSKAKLVLVDCMAEDRVLWFYDRRQAWLRTSIEGNFCLEAFPETNSLRIRKCKLNNMNQRWLFEHVNHTLLKSTI